MHGNDDSPTAVGMRLKHLRLLSGLNALELAEKAGVSRGALSFWENAKSKTARPISPKSVSKLIDAIRSAGVICSETWLITGTGPHPVTYKKGSENILQQNEISSHSASQFEGNHDLEDEISLFTSKDKRSIIHQITDDFMLPMYEIGDIVGGIWQSCTSLKGKEKACILKINNKLQVRRVKQSDKEGLFNICYLTYSVNQNEPYEINNISLEEIAPIIRLWRNF